MRTQLVHPALLVSLQSDLPLILLNTLDRRRSAFCRAELEAGKGVGRQNYIQKRGVSGV